MRRYILLIFILLSLCAFAEDNSFSIEKKILTKISHVLVPEKKVISIWYFGSKIPLSLSNNSFFDIVDDYKKADLIIIDEIGWKVKLDLHIPIVVLEYSLLKDYPDAVGAYFWQKGRPNIVMITPRIDKIGIKLPAEFKRYAESKVW